MTYIIIFKNDGLLKFDNLEAVRDLNHIEYIFQKELYQTIKNTTFNEQPIKHYNYRYSLINPDGTKRVLKKGKFELIDIGVDTRYFKTFTGREISLYDSAKSALRKFKSMTEDESFIIKDLLPTLNTLRLTNSWDIYLQLNEVKTLNSKIEKLIAEIDKHKKNISALQAKIDSLESSGAK